MKDTANVKTDVVRMVPLAEMPEVVEGTSYYMWRRLALSGAIPAIRSGGKGKILVELGGALKYLSSASLKDLKNEATKKTGIREVGNDKYNK